MAYKRLNLFPTKKQSQFLCVSLVISVGLSLVISVGLSLVISVGLSLVIWKTVGNSQQEFILCTDMNEIEFHLTANYLIKWTIK